MLAVDYVVQALARSGAARPDLLATAQGELLSELNRLVEAAFVDAAQANAPYFSARTTVPYNVLLSPAGWAFPVDAVRVFRAEATALTTGLGVGFGDGDEITLVPQHDRYLGLEAPAVAVLGRVLIPTGATGHPTGGDLEVSYARRPVAMAGLASAIDASWPAEHDELLIVQLAHYLAVKDFRGEDAATFERAAGQMFARFAAAVGLPVPAQASRSPRPTGARLQTE